MLCLKHVLSLLLLCGLARAFSMDESTDRSNSEVFPLVFNPFDVSHFKCLGYTLFENTVASSAYTYEVDVCFLAALATKLAFPWIYQYFTGESLFPQLRELGIPLLDSVKPADVRGEVQVSDYQDYQEYFEYNVEAKSAPSIQERASNWFAELGKAVTKEPNRKLRKVQMNLEEIGQEELNFRRDPEFQQEENLDLKEVEEFGQRDQFRERKRMPSFF